MKKLKKTLIKDLSKNSSLLKDEDAKQALRIKEVDHKIDVKLNNEEDYKVNLNNLQQEIRQNKKVIENIASSGDVFIKRNDELRSRVDVINRDMKTYENRLSEILATESERKQSYISFIEQQSLIKNDRERIWAEWTTQFEESISQIYKVLPELQSHQTEIKKYKAQFDEISQKFDRRANEITEMYRLLDDKFQKRMGYI